MTPWPVHPVVHEIFTWVWLHDLSAEHGRHVTLGDVPDEAWDAVAGVGIDAVWLMGVWQRSEVGAEIARHDEAARTDEAFAGWRDDDIVGSAYCVRDYVVDDRIGGDAGLAAAREALRRRGVRLVLDFVPNHVAPDHRWTSEHPEFFIRGTDNDLRADPGSFRAVGDHVFACGRDPYFPAWSDVVQLDTSRDDVRTAMAEVVASIARRCDCVRCDMAMLVLDGIFERTWGERATNRPRTAERDGFWPTVIEATRSEAPDFVFWAEAYWDLEHALIGQGFDGCYDKRLYDRLVQRLPAHDVRAHLGADPEYQRHMIRFVENHDEPRAAAVLPPEAHRAALAITLTLPGVALLHEGEADGRRVRVPVTFGRRPTEPVDGELHAFVDRLLGALDDGLRRGRWKLLAVDGWPDNGRAEHLIAWAWTSGEARHLVVANLSGREADGMVRWPWPELTGEVGLHDLLSGGDYRHDAEAVRDDGLYVRLDPHGVHVMRVRGRATVGR